MCIVYGLRAKVVVGICVRVSIFKLAVGFCRGEDESLLYGYINFFKKFYKIGCRSIFCRVYFTN